MLLSSSGWRRERAGVRQDFNEFGEDLEGDSEGNGLKWHGGVARVAGPGFRRKKTRGRRREEIGSVKVLKQAEVAHLVEHQPSKLRVASSSLVFRSEKKQSDQASDAVESAE